MLVEGLCLDNAVLDRRWHVLPNGMERAACKLAAAYNHLSSACKRTRPAKTTLQPVLNDKSCIAVGCKEHRSSLCCSVQDEGDGRTAAERLWARPAPYIYV